RFARIAPDMVRAVMPVARITRRATHTFHKVLPALIARGIQPGQAGKQQPIVEAVAAAGKHFL
ncbi:MAG: hypothetical protein NTY79_05435, partial [Chloroflexi bacterium]|nr:hypothetical protein [Chloroflexota bacterium]